MASAYSYNPNTSPLAMNVNDYISARQAYANQNYANYLAEKDAYQQFQDMQAKAQYSSEAESELHQAKSGGAIAGDALSGAGTGATIGSAFSPLGALIGAGVGGLGGLLFGEANASKAQDQYNAAMSKANSQPTGMWAGTDPNVTGIGGFGQIMSGASQLGKVAGAMKGIGGSSSSSNNNLQNGLGSPDPTQGQVQPGSPMSSQNMPQLSSPLMQNAFGSGATPAQPPSADNQFSAGAQLQPPQVGAVQSINDRQNQGSSFTGSPTDPQNLQGLSAPGFNPQRGSRR